jgi:Ca2+-dependent lipid-binding protein
LHIDVYDEDSMKDEKIGSVNIDLRELIIGLKLLPNSV